jgi:hypothetical protein
MNKPEIRVLVESIEEVTKSWLESLFPNNSIIYIKSEDYRRGRVDTIALDIAIVDGTKDVCAEYYSEIPGKYTNSDSEQDRKDYNVFYYAKNSGALLIGLEKGAHLATVRAGGSLIQHVENHKKPHKILMDYCGMKCTVASNHHQLMYPYELGENQYEILAHSYYFMSETYLNGRNEEKELDKKFLEPEIVYYNNISALAIQGHPCKTGSSDSYQSLLRDLVHSKIAQKKEQQRKLRERFR